MFGIQIFTVSDFFADEYFSALKLVFFFFLIGGAVRGVQDERGGEWAADATKHDFWWTWSGQNNLPRYGTQNGNNPIRLSNDPITRHLLILYMIGLPIQLMD